MLDILAVNNEFYAVDVPDNAKVAINEEFKFTGFNKEKENELHNRQP